MWGHFLSIFLPFKFHFPAVPSIVVPVVVATVTVAMVIIVVMVLVVVCVRYKMRVILREDYEAMSQPGRGAFALLTDSALSDLVYNIACVVVAW